MRSNFDHYTKPIRRNSTKGVEEGRVVAQTLLDVFLDTKLYAAFLNQLDDEKGVLLNTGVLAMHQIKNPPIKIFPFYTPTSLRQRVEIDPSVVFQPIIKTNKTSNSCVLGMSISPYKLPGLFTSNNLEVFERFSEPLANSFVDTLITLASQGLKAKKNKYKIVEDPNIAQLSFLEGTFLTPGVELNPLVRLSFFSRE